MECAKLAAALRERVRDFGEKPAYVLSSEEFTIGTKCGSFHVKQQEDRGDGTTVTTVEFEGNLFLCIKETEED